MEDFPEQYVNVTRPLVVLLGLQDETANSNLPKPLNNGTVVNADGPALTLGRRAAIRQAVKRYGSYLLDERGEVEQQALPSQTLIFHFKESNKVSRSPLRRLYARQLHSHRDIALCIPVAQSESTAIPGIPYRK